MQLSSLFLFCYFVAALGIITNDTSAEEGHRIYQRGFTEGKLLHYVGKAERELRIYIYPIPETSPSFEVPFGLLHFEIERSFTTYLRNLQKASEKLSESDDSRAGMIVSDPEQANVFIIEQYYLSTQWKSEAQGEQHLSIVIDNVLNLPYYKRNGGIDHFFFGLFDKGPFCMNLREGRISDLYRRIEGANVIGNYGMDRAYEEQYHCSRPGSDIVIPQDMNMRTTVVQLYREYDSVFTGSTWWSRQPLEIIAQTMEVDYEYNHTENLLYHFSGSTHPHLVKNGYFGYDACGFGCWSQRKYNLIEEGTVPLVITSGAIQAFERFIHWPAFTVKMNEETWYDEKKRNVFRYLIRKESDIFRGILKNFYDDYMELNPTSANKSLKEVAELIESAGFNSSHYHQLRQTLVWRKMKAMSEVIPWFRFLRYSNPPYCTENVKHAFRLLVLEIWCNYKANNKAKPICSTYPTDYTARKEYFYKEGSDLASSVNGTESFHRSRYQRGLRGGEIH